jgi:hypothetical protein
MADSAESTVRVCNRQLGGHGSNAESEFTRMRAAAAVSFGD